MTCYHNKYARKVNVLYKSASRVSSGKLRLFPRSRHTEHTGNITAEVHLPSPLREFRVDGPVFPETQVVASHA